MEGDFSIINKTKGKLPSLPFVSMKNEILGKNYILSIAFVDSKKSRELNKQYRQKDYATNVLSFALRKNEGELVLCPTVIRREAKNFDKTFEQFTSFLVIHGMLHLKGLEHSSTMERIEKKYWTKYDKKHHSRDRHGLLHDKSHSGRIPKRRKKS